MRAWIQDATMYQFEGMRYIEWCFDFHNPTVEPENEGVTSGSWTISSSLSPIGIKCVCVCVSIMHQLEATRKANPKEYEATVYISSYISTYRDNTRERKQWLILTISTAWPSGIPLNQGAGGTSWCWHQASSNAWGHNPDWLAMSPSPTQYPFTSIHHRAHRGPAPHHISFFPANFATFWNPIAVIPLVSIFHVT